MSALGSIKGREAVRPGTRRAIIAGMLGHILEWFDFAVYGYLAVILAANFFPADNPTSSLLASFAAFGVGFFARPLGAIYFGRLGDTAGRRFMLMWTMVLMAAATVVIGLLPTYAQIGIGAPILLVLCRLAQGFSAGGETTGATAFIVEWAPVGRRGLTGSAQQIGSAMGLLLGSLSAALLTELLTKEDLYSWGWRIPFIVGGVLAPVGLMIRRSVGETPHFAEANKAAQEILPAWAITKMILRAFMFTSFWTVGFYFFLSYMPTFAQRELKISPSTSFWFNVASTSFYICLVPFIGALSDRIGRKTLLIGSCVGFAVLLYPVFSALAGGLSIAYYFAAVMLFAVLLATFAGAAPAFNAELFPTRYRTTGMALGNSCATIVFGGFTPFIATWLIATFNTPLAPIYYVVTVAILCGLFILTVPETAKRPLG